MKKRNAVTDTVLTSNLNDLLQLDVDAVQAYALAIRQVDAGSCNGCELEIHALANPYYNIEGLGIKFVASPRHADMLLVTGPVSRNMEVALRRTYDATPEPKLVVAVGDCGRDGGIFGEGYATCGGVARVIPVDVVVPGCPPTPTFVTNYAIYPFVGLIDHGFVWVPQDTEVADFGRPHGHDD